MIVFELGYKLQSNQTNNRRRLLASRPGLEFAFGSPQRRLIRRSQCWRPDPPREIDGFQYYSKEGKRRDRKRSAFQKDRRHPCPGRTSLTWQLVSNDPKATC